MSIASAERLDAETVLGDPEACYFEIIDGHSVEQPPMGTESVWVVNRILNRLIFAIRDPGQGMLFTEMLYTLRKSPLLRRRPDISFVSPERWPLTRPIPRDNGWEVIPDLVVEVVSPSDPFEDVIDRVHDFFHAGSKHAWLVLPKTRQVYVYDAEHQGSIRVLSNDDELTGAPLFPEFRAPISTFFPPLPPS